MAELINLRAARKRAKREKDEARAQTNRLAHGQSKRLHVCDAAERMKNERDLDRHRIDKGDGR